MFARSFQPKEDSSGRLMVSTALLTCLTTSMGLVRVIREQMTCELALVRTPGRWDDGVDVDGNDDEFS